METIDTVLVFFLVNGGILASEGTVSYFGLWFQNYIRDNMIAPTFFDGLHPDTGEKFLIGLNAVQSIADVPRDNVKAGARKIITPRDN